MGQRTKVVKEIKTGPLCMQCMQELHAMHAGWPCPHCIQGGHARSHISPKCKRKVLPKLSQTM